ncbi:MAG: cytochrome b N-terminal domain-containing protein [Mangrovibacterium sp.]
MPKEPQQSGIMKFILHIHPPKLSKKSMQLTRTYGLGGISALLFMVLAITGAFLRFKYVPTIEEAYYSIVRMQDFEVFGRLLRNLHYWSANLMILVVVLHMLRVVFSNSLYYERAKNWRYGIVMLLFTLLFAFTGYLLTWDQLSYWAVTIMLSLVEYIPVVGASISEWIKGGEHIGQQTLLTFYSLHTGLLPFLFVVLMMVHFYLVRKAKGVTYTLAEEEEDERVKSYPDLVRVEALAALGTFVVLLVLSILFNAPLKEMANPEITPNPSKAPWYFIGLQEMLLHFHPLIVLSVPILALWAAFKMPVWRCAKEKVGLWWNGKENKSSILLYIGISSVWTFVLAIADDLLRAKAHLETASWYGVLLFIIYLLPLAGILWKRKKEEKALLVLIAFSFILMSYVVFSVVAYFLRGEGMGLIIMN